jgi:hypothetical protein
MGFNVVEQGEKCKVAQPRPKPGYGSIKVRIPLKAMTISRWALLVKTVDSGLLDASISPTMLFLTPQARCFSLCSLSTIPLQILLRQEKRLEAGSAHSYNLDASNRRVAERFATPFQLTSAADTLFSILLLRISNIISPATSRHATMQYCLREQMLHGRPRSQKPCSILEADVEYIMKTIHPTPYTPFVRTTGPACWSAYFCSFSRKKFLRQLDTQEISNAFLCN